ncbi:unnamed protein product [Paramecium sonneborni]|uniref:Uncharacterized protein n=1 Tax=Paramecium sonneborni TaxID=65129 RepID=A0A8S1RGU5_9CILI|nr:unnamed protein product [Paramecium sonneborni]
MEAQQYKLSQTLRTHNNIVRSISIQVNELLTCLSDKTAKIFEMKSKQQQELTF